jgi:hypothetical protein
VTGIFIYNQEKIFISHMPPLNKDYKEGGIVPVSLAIWAKGDRYMGFMG